MIWWLFKDNAFQTLNLLSFPNETLMILGITNMNENKYQGLRTENRGLRIEDCVDKKRPKEPVIDFVSGFR